LKVTAEQIKELVRFYQPLVGLRGWRISVSFAPEDQGDMGGATCSPEYYRATLTFNLDQLPNLREAEATVIHELMHVVLSPYTEMVHSMFKDHVAPLTLLEETLVTSIEKWPLWRKFQ
jgi:hypothetical protein